MDKLKEIIDFVNENKNKCVSTTHYLTVEEYNSISDKLIMNFNDFRVTKRVTPPYNMDKNKIVELKISIR